MNDDLQDTSMRAHNGDKAINLLFNVTPALFEDYHEPILDALRRRSIDARASLLGDIAHQDVDYIIHATGGPITDFRPFQQCARRIEPLGRCREDRRQRDADAAAVPHGR